MNRTTDDLLDALLSKQDLPEYFEENDAELQWQPAAYPDCHFGLRRVLHLCAGGGTGFLQLLLQLSGGGHSPSWAGGVLSFAFDLFNIRTRCTLVERFHHTKQYPFYCVCVMLSWLLFCFFVMFLGVGVFDSKK